MSWTVAHLVLSFSLCFCFCFYPFQDAFTIDAHNQSTITIPGIQTDLFSEKALVVRELLVPSQVLNLGTNGFKILFMQFIAIVSLISFTAASTLFQDCGMWMCPVVQTPLSLVLLSELFQVLLITLRTLYIISLLVCLFFWQFSFQMRLRSLLIRNGGLRWRHQCGSFCGWRFHLSKSYPWSLCKLRKQKLWQDSRWDLQEIVIPIFTLHVSARYLFPHIFEHQTYSLHTHILSVCFSFSYVFFDSLSFEL